MAQRYDARGNIYIVVAPGRTAPPGYRPARSGQPGSANPRSLALAAIEACCSWAPGTQPPGSKDHRSDGLLVGPFQASPPFDLLIVNTDGTLAERSGNGLTIFPRPSAIKGYCRRAKPVCSGFTTTRLIRLRRGRLQ